MNTVLSILAHPDDAEFLCAGSMIRLHDDHDWNVHIATMTAGDCGSVELSPEKIADVRRNEGQAAADRVGGTYHCLEERDLLIVYNETTLAKVTRLLRSVRPTIVFTHSPADYMVDHEMTSLIVRASAFAAPIPNFLKDQSLGDPLEGIPHLYYCDPIEGKDAMGEDVVPGFCIDISKSIEQKAAMLACHASQREWLLKHHGVDEYLNAMRAWAENRGYRCGVDYAEGFRQHLGHGYPQENLLGDLLGEIEIHPRL